MNLFLCNAKHISNFIFSRVSKAGSRIMANTRLPYSFTMSNLQFNSSTQSNSSMLIIAIYIFKSSPADAVSYKLLMRENINKIDKFLMIPTTKYLYAIANVVPATVSSIFYSSNFSQCQFINIFSHQKLHCCCTSQ